MVGSVLCNAYFVVVPFLRWKATDVFTNNGQDCFSVVPFKVLIFVGNQFISTEIVLSIALL